MQKSPLLTRRELLKVGSGLSVGSILPFSGLSASTLRTQAHIVIVGGGAAGMAMVNRLARRLQGGTITLVEPRETHHYQPGWTMVASGIWAAEKTMRLNAQFLPRGVKWLRDTQTALMLTASV